jgi:hypothetical protein
MQFLFSSLGDHIASEVNGHLHSPSGDNIGHFLSQFGIFIDMDGQYLGEIVEGNRLMFRRSSPHRSVNYGVYGNYGNCGDYGNPGNRGPIGMIPDYEDVRSARLTAREG